MKKFPIFLFLLLVSFKSIAIDEITLGSLSGTNFCAFNSISVPFTTTLHSGTQFTVRLKKGTSIIRSVTGNTSPIQLYMDIATMVYGEDYKIDIIAGSYSSAESPLLTIGNIGVAYMSDGENQQVYFSTDNICIGKSKTYYATVKDGYNTIITQNVNIQWKKNGEIIPGATQSQFTATEAGQYSFTATQGGCTLNSNQTGLQFISSISAVIKVEGDNFACTGTEKRLQASYITTTSTYQWFKDGVQISGATNRVHPSTVSGNYSVNIFDGACIGSIGPKQITFSNSLHAPIFSSNSDTTICGGTGVQLVANSVFEFPNQYQYQWQRNGVDIVAEQYYPSTTSAYYARQAGNYSVIYKQGTCVSTSKILQVVSSNLAQKPVITIQNGFDICQGSVKINQINKANLLNGFSSSLAGYFYSGIGGKWFKDGVEIPNYYNDSFTATQAGTYKMKAGYGSCEVESNEIVLSFASPISPKIVASNNKNNLCGINDYTFLYVDTSNLPNTNFTYIWKKNNIVLPDQTSNTLYANTIGEYTIIITNGSCTGTSNAITITNTNSFSLETNNNDLSCTNQMVKLKPQNLLYDFNTPLVWKLDNNTINGETGSSLYTNSPGSYTASINQNGCIATSIPLIINSNQVPSAPSINNLSINNGETAQIMATGCTGTINWYNVASGGNSLFTGNPFTTPILNSNTNYYADCSNSSCTSITRKSVLVTVIGGVGPIQIGNLPSLNYCVGNNISIPFTSTLPSGTVYTAKLYKGAGLISTINSSSNPISMYLNTNLLYGADYKITISAGEFTSPESPLITIGVINYGYVTDEFKNSLGNTYLCPGKEKQIFAAVFSNYDNNPIENNITYQWKKNGVNIEGATANMLTVSANGVYTFAATQGCTINGYSVTLETTPNIPGDYFGGGSNMNCAGTTKKLTAFYFSTSATYQWQKDNIDIPNALNRVYNAGESGIYTVKVFDGTCQANYGTGSRLTFGTGLTAKILASNGDTTLCGNNGVSINVINDASTSAPYTYKWLKNGDYIQNAISTTYFVYEPGLYSVEFKQGECISKSKTVEIVSGTKAQKPLITAGKMTEICAGSIQINQNTTWGIPNAPYFGLYGLWYKDNVLLSSSTSSSFNATASGNYKMVYGSGNCAIESNAVSINIGGTTISPKIFSTNSKLDLNLCGYNDFIYLASESAPNVNLSNVSYQWRKNGENLPGQTSNTLFVTSPGEYSLFLVNDVCAGLSNAITITNNNQINVSISDNDIYCANRAVLLETDTRAGFKTAIWKRNDVVIPNESSNFLYTTLPGNYTVTVDEYGCQATSTVVQLNAGVPAELFTIKSGNWNEPLCWICGVLPTATTDVKISNGHIINVPIGVHEVKNVKLEGIVNFEVGGEVKVNGGN
jgi:hypothetical protein